VPVGEWLRGAFLDELARRLPNSEAIDAWCEPDAVRALLARQQARHDVTREVWSLLQFAIWHRLFISGDGRVPGSEEDPLTWL
jgi:asparagine synthase (glutamine-hydrolysing)